MVSPKRSLSPEHTETPDAKRPRTDSNDSSLITELKEVEFETEIAGEHDESTETFVSKTPTRHSQSRLGIQRAIALVLKHDGFDSATPEALESFTQMIETCRLFLSHSSMPSADADPRPRFDYWRDETVRNILTTRTSNPSRL